MLLNVTVGSEPGATVLRVTGELDAATSDLPVVTAERAVAETRPRQLVLDLTQVTFLGSSGIGALVRIRNLCEGNGIHLRLRGLRPQARKLLVLTGLDGSFDVAADTPP